MTAEQALDFLACCEEAGGTMVALPGSDDNLELALLRVYDAEMMPPESGVDTGRMVVVSDYEGTELIRFVMPSYALLPLVEEPLHLPEDEA